MRPNRYAVVLHVALVALAATTLGLAYQNRELRSRMDLGTVTQLDIGAQVSDFDVETLDGDHQAVRWSDGAPDRLLMVFTTTCPACKANQEAWRTVHAALPSGIEVVGISLDPREPTRTYREAANLPFDVVAVADRQAFAMAYEIPVVPTTLHIAGNGTVLGVWPGALTPRQRREVVASARG